MSPQYGGQSNVSMDVQKTVQNVVKGVMGLHLPKMIILPF
jgi:hypothetical protein